MKSWLKNNWLILVTGLVIGIAALVLGAHGNPGSYEMPPKMLQTTINEPCEIVSFMGEITRKCDAPAGLPCQVTNTPSDYIVHVHMTCSHGENATVTGGGFRKATVLRAVNVYVLEVEDENELC